MTAKNNCNSGTDTRLQRNRLRVPLRERWSLATLPPGQRPTANDQQPTTGFLIFRNPISIFPDRGSRLILYLRTGPAPGLTQEYVSVSPLYPGCWWAERSLRRIFDVRPQEKNSSGNRTRAPRLAEPDWPDHGWDRDRCSGTCSQRTSCCDHADFSI